MSDSIFMTSLSDIMPTALKSLEYSIVYSDSFIDPNKDKLDPPHIHNYLELLLNVSGEKSFWVDNKLYKVNEGDVIVSLPNEVHVCVFERPMKQSYFCLWIDSENKNEIVELFKKSNNSRLYSFGKDRDKILKSFFSLVNKKDEKDGLDKVLLLFQILSLFKNNAEYSSEKIVDVPPLLSEISAYIDKNFKDIRKMSDVSEKFYISVPTLDRLFLKYIHVSPHKFIESKKLAYASELLFKGFSVTEASEISGFSDCSHFIVKFKQRFGMTPFQYKNRAK